MAATSTSIVHGTAGGNAFVTSNKPISDMLQALVTAGALSQTADTGQVSWGSVAASNASTTYYEIFKLNDSLNATFPLFLKFLYVPNVTTTLPTSVQISIGTGSDGAGNLTGACTPVTVRGGVASAAAVDLGSRACWASAGEGYLNLFGGFNGTQGASSSGAFCLSIERLRNSSGVIQGDGISVVAAMQYETTSAGNLFVTGGSSYSHIANAPYVANCYAAQRSNIPNIFAQSNNVWPPVANKGSAYYQTPQFDGANYLAAAIQPYAGKLYPAQTGILICDSIFPAMSNPSLSLYGTARTYQTLNLNMPALMPAYISPINTAVVPAFTVMGLLLALRWE